MNDSQKLTRVALYLSEHQLKFNSTVRKFRLDPAWLAVAAQSALDQLDAGSIDDHVLYPYHAYECLPYE